MLRAALGPGAITLLALDLSAEEAVLEAIEQRPAAICIGAISATRGAEVRNYCRRIRSAIPDTRLVVFRPQTIEADVSRAATRMQEAGADIVAINVKDAAEAIERLLAGLPGELRDARARQDTGRDAGKSLAAASF